MERLERDLENLSFCLFRVPPIILFFNIVARVSSIPPHPRDTTSVVWVPPIHFTPFSLRLPLLVRAAGVLGYPFSLPLFYEYQAVMFLSELAGGLDQQIIFSTASSAFCCSMTVVSKIFELFRDHRYHMEKPWWVVPTGPFFQNFRDQKAAVMKR